VRLLDFLGIKELGEIALASRGAKENEVISEFDPPEKQKCSGKSNDIWALGVLFFQVIRFPI